jgi:hypothetical protein
MTRYYGDEIITYSCGGTSAVLLPMWPAIVSLRVPPRVPGEIRPDAALRLLVAAVAVPVPVAVSAVAVSVIVALDRSHGHDAPGRDLSAGLN